MVVRALGHLALKNSQSMVQTLVARGTSQDESEGVVLEMRLCTQWTSFPCQMGHLAADGVEKGPFQVRGCPLEGTATATTVTTIRGCPRRRQQQHRQRQARERADRRGRHRSPAV